MRRNSIDIRRINKICTQNVYLCFFTSQIPQGDWNMYIYSEGYLISVLHGHLWDALLHRLRNLSASLRSAPPLEGEARGLRHKRGSPGSPPTHRRPRKRAAGSAALASEGCARAGRACRRQWRDCCPGELAQPQAVTERSSPHKFPRRTFFTLAPASCSCYNRAYPLRLAVFRAYSAAMCDTIMVI